jgi:uracil-DNA glycosylase
MNEFWTSLQHFLESEREVFGDYLLLDSPSPPSQDALPITMATRRTTATTPASPSKQKQPDPDGMVLFELPAPAQPATHNEAWMDAEDLPVLNGEISGCLKCALGQTRTKFVFGVGNPHATLMFIGEAPGADEDAQGEPFVGRAGQLLNKILAAITMNRADVYICNILKCRPPNNRTPLPEEVELCIPYLKKQIAIIKPKLIVCLGLTAAQNILHINDSLTKLRGRTLQFEGIPLRVTYHPAALLRNPNWKQPTWEDFQAIQKLHAELVAR